MSMIRTYPRALVRFRGPLDEPLDFAATDVRIDEAGLSGKLSGGAEDGREFYVPAHRLRLVAQMAPPVAPSGESKSS